MELRRGNRHLDPSVISAALTDDETTEKDFNMFSPVLEKARNRILRTKCCHVDIKTINCSGIIQTVCDTTPAPCQKTSVACPLCGDILTRFSSLKTHFEKCKLVNGSRICIACGATLSTVIGDEIKHYGYHFFREKSIVGVLERTDQQLTPPVPLVGGMTFSDRNPLVTDDFFQEGIVPSNFPEILHESISPLIGSTNVGANADTCDSPDEDEYLPVNITNHLSSVLGEIIYTSDTTEGYNVVIQPLESKEEGDYGNFMSEHNLRVLNFARDANLSKNMFQRLLNDLKTYYKSPLDFQSANTLTDKFHGLTAAGGIKYKEYKCEEKNHKVCFVPIEEGLRALFSKEEVLWTFHFGSNEKNSDEDRVFDFRDSKAFRREQKRVGETFGAHVITIIGNRDAFPGYLTSHLPLKGYYYCVGNISNPELGRNVLLFGFGMECESCKKCIEGKWVENINRLSNENFLIYHSLLEKYVISRLEFVCETDDSPQVADNTMSKHPTGNKGCPGCKCPSDKFTDPYAYESYPKKSLMESESIYKEKCLPIYQEGKVGKVTAVNKIEDEHGYRFSDLKYNPKLKRNETVLLKQTSFHGLNDYTKKNISMPNGPFHTIQKNLLLHIRDGISETLTGDEKRRVSGTWKKINFPKGVKKQNDPWKIGGNNFDAIISLAYCLPFCLKGVMNSQFVQSLEDCFDSIIEMKTAKDLSRKRILSLKEMFFRSIDSIRKTIDIDFPTTHFSFHLFDFALVLGPWENWDEKKFEVFHKIFKRKMRKCFLRNPSVFLTKEWVGDINFKVLFPSLKKEKWIFFSPVVSFTLYKQSRTTVDEVREKNILGVLGLDETECVLFENIQKLRVFTKVYERNERVVLKSVLRPILDIFLVCWVESDSEVQKIVVESYDSEDDEKRIPYTLKDLNGKGYVSGERLVKMYC